MIVGDSNTHEQKRTITVSTATSTDLHGETDVSVTIVRCGCMGETQNHPR